MSRIIKDSCWALVIVILIGFSGCVSKNENSCTVTFDLSSVDQNQLNTEIDSIDAYLERNNIEASVESRSGIRYVIHEQGTGPSPDGCDVIDFTYEGRFLSNQEVFDKSDSIVRSYLNGLIPGWQLVLPKLNQGGSMTIYIPSAYAYGPSGAGDTVPPNTTLIFDLQLAAVY